MDTPGQTDCSGTFTAPGNRAESGGWTTWSSVVHRDSHGGRVAEPVSRMYDMGFVIPIVRLPGARVQPREASQPTPGHAPSPFGMTS